MGDEYALGLVAGDYPLDEAVGCAVIEQVVEIVEEDEAPAPAGAFPPAVQAADQGGPAGRRLEERQPLAAFDDVHPPSVGDDVLLVVVLGAGEAEVEVVLPHGHVVHRAPGGLAHPLGDIVPAEGTVQDPPEQGLGAVQAFCAHVPGPDRRQAERIARRVVEIVIEDRPPVHRVHLGGQERRGLPRVLIDRDGSAEGELVMEDRPVGRSVAVDEAIRVLLPDFVVEPVRVVMMSQRAYPKLDFPDPLLPMSTIFPRRSPRTYIFPKR